MNLIEFFADKVGRKLLIAVATMMMMQQEQELSRVIAIGFVGLISIGIQAIVDWKHPRANGNGKEKQSGPERK